MISVNVVLRFKELYYFDIDYLKIEEKTGMSKEEMILNYDYLIDFNMDKTKGEFHMPTIKYSENGKIHFEEVREIFRNTKKVFLLTSFISIIGVYFVVKNKDLEFLKLTSKILFFLPIITFIPIAINFEKSFVTFHEIFFDNDYWIFDSRLDPVINILPSEFFLHCGVLILFLIFSSSLVFMLLYKASYRYK